LLIHLETKTSLWELQQIQGKISKALTSIPVYRYGLGDSIFFPLVRISGIRSVNLGQPEESQDILQSSIEADYFGVLSNDCL
jgi:hypothetical protein